MADIHIADVAVNATELEQMRDKMIGYIFPNTPRTCDERIAFEKACAYQVVHEKSIAAQSGEQIPQGATAFKIGDFSMNFASGYNENALTRKTICPYAYGVLLRAGLLYKGVERPY